MNRSRMLVRISALALGGVMSLVAGRSPALGETPPTYDVAADFSATNDPNGVWSYGWSASRGSVFNLATNPFSLVGLQGWDTGVGNGFPGVFYNGTGDSITYATATVPAGKLALHPGPVGENAVVRWTAPASGTYQINSAFTGIDSSYPTTTDVAVLHGSTELFAGTVSSYDVPLPFSTERSISAGESIDFTVGDGGNGYLGDSTSLDATIVLTAAPPAPALDLAVSRIAINLDFARPGRDSAQVRGTIAFPDGVPALEGKTLDLDVGGFLVSYDLHTVRRGVVATNRLDPLDRCCVLGLVSTVRRPVAGGATVGELRFLLKLRSIDLSAVLAGARFLRGGAEASGTRDVTVGVAFDDRTGRQTVTLDGRTRTSVLSGASRTQARHVAGAILSAPAARALLALAGDVTVHPTGPINDVVADLRRLLDPAEPINDLAGDADLANRVVLVQDRTSGALRVLRVGALDPAQVGGLRVGDLVDEDSGMVRLPEPDAADPCCTIVGILSARSARGLLVLAADPGVNPVEPVNELVANLQRLLDGAEPINDIADDADLANRVVLARDRTTGAFRVFRIGGLEAGEAVALRLGDLVDDTTPGEVHLPEPDAADPCCTIVGILSARSARGLLALAADPGVNPGGPINELVANLQRLLDGAEPINDLTGDTDLANQLVLARDRTTGAFRVLRVGTLDAAKAQRLRLGDLIDGVAGTVRVPEPDGADPCCTIAGLLTIRSVRHLIAVSADPGVNPAEPINDLVANLQRLLDGAEPINDLTGDDLVANRVVLGETERGRLVPLRVGVTPRATALRLAIGNAVGEAAVGTWSLR